MDEEKRLIALHKDATKVSLLEKYGYTEEMAKELCLKYGLLSPGYQFSKRGGCWFCPYAKLEEQRLIKEVWCDAWEKFVALEEENLANNRWNVFRNTLRQQDSLLEYQFYQSTLFDLEDIRLN